MATKVNIGGGKITARPGTYSIITANVRNQSAGLPYGNILIVDTGIGAGYGGGSGIAGANASGVESVYFFPTIQDYQGFVKGGKLWNLGLDLYKPKQGVSGVSGVYFVQARTTTPAAINSVLTNGSVKVKTQDEGVNANGVLATGNLSKGYGLEYVDAGGGKFRIRFWLGTYKGLDSLNSEPYGGTALAANATPILVAETTPLNTFAELTAWMERDRKFKEAFINDGTTATGNIIAGDLSAHTGYNIFSGATETYNTANLTAAIIAVRGLDYSFILATEYGNTANATGATNFALLDHILPTGSARFIKTLVVPGGYDQVEYADSVEIAGTFDNERVITVHGGFGLTKREGGFRYYDALNKAARVLGRICGLEPQTPATLKTIDIDKEVHTLSVEEQEDAIDKGVLYTAYDDDLKDFTIGLDINTLQADKSEFLINEDGTSYNIALNRIKAQIDKEVVVESKKRFFSGETGPNRSTVSEIEIEEWLTKTFFPARIANDSVDNLIMKVQNVVVTRDQDNYYASYEFVPNTEIKAIVFSGAMING